MKKGTKVALITIPALLLVGTGIYFIFIKKSNKTGEPTIKIPVFTGKTEEEKMAEAIEIANQIESKWDDFYLNTVVSGPPSQNHFDTFKNQNIDLFKAMTNLGYEFGNTNEVIGQDNAGYPIEKGKDGKHQWRTSIEV